MADTTHIPYMYRDAANYKVCRTLVLRGSITAEQVEQLRATLHDGDHFIPTQIGMPHLGTESGWASFPCEDDHIWHELELDAVEEGSGREDEAWFSVEEFITMMTTAAQRWDDTVSVEDVI